MGPIVSPGANLPLKFGQNIFSQISSKLEKKSLSEVDPLESLNKVTAPLNDLFKAIGAQLDVGVGGNSSSLIRARSNLGGLLGLGDRSSGISSVWEMIKSVFTLVGNIFVAVLEVTLSIIKSILIFIS